MTTSTGVDTERGSLLWDALYQPARSDTSFLSFLVSYFFLSLEKTEEDGKLCQTSCTGAYDWRKRGKN